MLLYLREKDTYPKSGVAYPELILDNHFDAYPGLIRPVLGMLLKSQLASQVCSHHPVCQCAGAFGDRRFGDFSG